MEGSDCASAAEADGDVGCVGLGEGVWVVDDEGVWGSCWFVGVAEAAEVPGGAEEAICFAVALIFVDVVTTP